MIRLASILLLLTLPACAALKGGDAPVTMRVSPRFAVGPLQPAPTLAVAPVQARGLSGGARYAYVDAATPGEIRQAATQFWEEPPATTLARALVAGLRTRFAAVTGPDLSLAADRRIVSTLDRFEEVTGAGAAQAATCAWMMCSGNASPSDGVIMQFKSPHQCDSRDPLCY